MTSGRKWDGYGEREKNENDRRAREGARRMKIKEEIMNCTFHRLLQSA